MSRLTRRERLALASAALRGIFSGIVREAIHWIWESLGF